MLPRSPGSEGADDIQSVEAAELCIGFSLVASGRINELARTVLR